MTKIIAVETKMALEPDLLKHTEDLRLNRQVVFDQVASVAFLLLRSASNTEHELLTNLEALDTRIQCKVLID